MINLKELFDAVVAISIWAGLGWGGMRALEYVRRETLIEVQKGLPSLSAFTHQLTDGTDGISGTKNFHKKAKKNK